MIAEGEVTNLNLGQRLPAQAGLMSATQNRTRYSVRKRMLNPTSMVRNACSRPPEMVGSVSTMAEATASRMSAITSRLVIDRPCLRAEGSTCDSLLERLYSHKPPLARG